MTGMYNLIDNVMLHGYIDDHNGQHRNVQDLLVHMVHGHVDVCPGFFESRGFCLNPLYEDEDGIVHLSTRSSGSTIVAVGKTKQEAVAQYNAEHTFSSGFFSQVTLVTREEWQKEYDRLKPYRKASA